MSTPRFFGYARKSPTGFTAGQTASDGIPSLDRQEADLFAMSEKFPDCAYAGCFREHESAVEVAWDERAVLKALLAELRPGDHLGVWRLDRLDRKPFRLMGCLQALFDREITIHAEMAMGGLPVDLTTAMGRGIVMMLAWMADMSREYTADAMKRGLAFRRASGLAMGGVPPLGCRFVPIPGKKTKLGNQERRVVWDEAECALIREIRMRHVAGESLSAIARDFVERKLRSPGGTLWNRSRVDRAYRWYESLLAAGRDLGDLPLSDQATEALQARDEEARQERAARAAAIHIEKAKKNCVIECNRAKKNRRELKAKILKFKQESKPKTVPAWAVRLWQGSSSPSSSEPGAPSSSQPSQGAS